VGCFFFIPARHPRPGRRGPPPGAATTLLAVVRALDEADVTVVDIGLRRPSLDDVFLALTGHAAEVAE
jgi:ABC-2 type transport system ATP-binding protein